MPAGHYALIGAPRPLPAGCTRTSRRSSGTVRSAATDRSTSALVVFQLQQRDAQAAAPAPGGRGHQAGAVAVQRCDHRVDVDAGGRTRRASGSGPARAPRSAASSASRSREALGARAQPVDELGDAAAPELAQRRVDGQPARAAENSGFQSTGSRSAPSSRLLRGSSRPRPSRPGAPRGRRRPRCRSRTARSATCARPSPTSRRARRRRRAAAGGAGSPTPTARTRRRRAARRPCRSAMSRDRVERVDRAGVHVARPARRRSAARSRPRARRRARRRASPRSVDVDRLDARRPEPEQPQRAVDRGVALGAGEHADRAARPIRPSRSTSQPARSSTPPARRGEAGGVRHLAAGDEARTTRAAGRPSTSSSQRPATASTAATAGVGSARPAFWSHAEVIQSAASAAGSAPPITNPKNRGWFMPVSPGSQSRDEIVEHLARVRRRPRAAGRRAPRGRSA